MFSTKKSLFKSPTNPIDGYIVKDILDSVVKSSLDYSYMQSFAIARDKKGLHVFNLVLLGYSVLDMEGAAYSDGLIDEICDRLEGNLATAMGDPVHSKNGTLLKDAPHLKKYRNMELMGVGIAVPVNNVGNISTSCGAYETVISLCDQSELRVMMDDGKIVGGTTTFDYGNLFKSEKIDELNFSTVKTNILGDVFNLLVS